MITNKSLLCFDEPAAERMRIVLLRTLIILSIAVKCFVMRDGFLHCWDERYHALVAKHLMDHPLVPTLYEKPLLSYNMDNWTGNHIWLHKQPLSLWLIAGSLKLFGLHEFAVRLPSLLLSTLGILLCYDMGRRLFNSRVGLIAAFLYAINGLLLDLASGRMATDHPDICLSFFVLAGIWCGLHACAAKGKSAIGWFLLTGVATGAALLSKWLPGLIVYPVVWMLSRDHRYHRSWQQVSLWMLLSFVVAMLLFLPWQWHIRHAFPREAQWESHYNYLHFIRPLEGQGASWYYFIDRIRIDYGELIYLPLLYFGVSVLRTRDSRMLALLCWILLPLLVFSCAATKMAGYMFIAAPAFFLLTAVFMDLLLQQSLLRSVTWLRVLLLIAFFVIPVRYCLERARFFEKQDTQWVADLKSWQPGANPKVVLLGYKASVEAMFYHACTAYDFIPSREQVRDLLDKGYRVYVATRADAEQLQLPDVQVYRGTLPPY